MDQLIVGGGIANTFLLAKDANIDFRVIAPMGRQYAFRFNTLHKPFDNPKVRQAVLAAFSQQQSLMSRELQLSVARLNKGSAATVSAISQQTSSTQTLAASSRRLIEAVSQFTLPQAA